MLWRMAWIQSWESGEADFRKARIFSGRPVLMLDESTSALDGVTEQRLLANLRAMTNKTVLIVTHREEALRICDKQIIMTEDGRLAVKERILT